jgi:hypothetical protein
MELAGHSPAVVEVGHLMLQIQQVLVAAVAAVMVEEIPQMLHQALQILAVVVAPQAAKAPYQEMAVLV